MRVNSKHAIIADGMAMLHRTIRLHRKDSAFTYAILESLEGMTSYTTLSDVPGQMYRDLELCISPGFAEEVNIVIEGLRKKFPVIEIKEGPILKEEEEHARHD